MANKQDFQKVGNVLDDVVEKLDTNTTDVEINSDDYNILDGISVSPTKANSQPIEPMEEVILPSSLKDVAFTVSIHPEINQKFESIWSYFQSVHRYGRVYKKDVLAEIIDATYKHMRNKGQIK